MDARQKVMIEKNKERGSHEERRMSMLMQARDLDLPLFNMNPVPDLQALSFQPEPILFCLCVGGEARGEPVEGIEHVASVIMNRYLSQRYYFGYTIHDVIMKNSGGVWQFSAMNPMNVNRKWMENPDGASWIKVCKAALPIYFGKKVISPSGMFYYISDKIEPPKWTEKLVEHIHIGGHRFYKEI